jgi:hypothetical protein
MTATPLSPSHLSQLEAVARAATPGPWSVREESHETLMTAAVVNVNGMYVAESACQPDDEFIAAFSPSTALALLERIRELEAGLREACNMLDGTEPGGLAELLAKREILRRLAGPGTTEGR